MANRSLQTRAEVAQTLAGLLDPAYELFACEVANGMTLADASISAGFSDTYGQDLLSKDNVRLRIQELLSIRASEGLASRAWIEAQMYRQYVKVQGLPDEMTVKQASAAVGILMNMAKFKGWIVDRKSSVSAKIDLSKLPTGQASQVFNDAMKELSPESQRKLKELQSSLRDEDDIIDIHPEPSGAL